MYVVKSCQIQLILETIFQESTENLSQIGQPFITGCKREEFAFLLQSFVVAMRTLRIYTLYIQEREFAQFGYTLTNCDFSRKSKSDYQDILERVKFSALKVCCCIKLFLLNFLRFGDESRDESINMVCLL